MSTQGQTNEAFLAQLDNMDFLVIMNNIAEHYGISTENALAEVTDSEAESIIDYVTGPKRPAVSALFNQYKRSL